MRPNSNGMQGEFKTASMGGNSRNFHAIEYNQEPTSPSLMAHSCDRSMGFVCYSIALRHELTQTRLSLN